MAYPFESELEITDLECGKGPLVTGALRAKTRVPRPPSEGEGPATYTLTYNRSTGDLKLRIVKWSGFASYVEHPLASNAREDIRYDLKKLLPVVLSLADNFSRQKAQRRSMAPNRLSWKRPLQTC
jgi:hypothetical protein